MAFVDTNYLNPSAMQPKIGWQPENALAGAMWNQGNRDYRQVLEQQMRMQAMSEEQRRMQMEKERKDVPLQDLTRSIQMESGQGQLPLARELAGATAQSGIAEQKYKKDVTWGPDAIKDQLVKFRKTADDATWERMGREQTTAAALLESARAMGPVKGLEYVMAKKAELEKMGMKLPDYIQDPANWDKLYEAAVNSVAQKQKIDVEDKKGEWNLRQTQTSAGATIRAAEINAEAAKYKADNAPERGSKTVDEELIKLTNELANTPNPADKDKLVDSRLIPALEMKRENQIKDLVLAGTVSEDVGKKLKATKKEWVNDQLKARGIISKEQSPGATQDPNKYKQKYGLD